MSHDDHEAAHSQRSVQPPMLTRKEMEDAWIPLTWRDKCSALLVDLNACRFESFGLPWKCEAKRNAFMKCEADDFHRRQHLAQEARLDDLRRKTGK